MKLYDLVLVNGARTILPYVMESQKSKKHVRVRLQSSSIRHLHDQILEQIRLHQCHVIRSWMLTMFEKHETDVSLLPIRKALNRNFIVVGGYNRSEGNKVIANGGADLVAYSRLFLANSDLPKRCELDVELNKADSSTFQFLHQ